MRNTKICFVLLSLFTNLFAFSQKIDTDSLLVVASKQINIEKKYSEAIQLARLGIKLAPTYLDFHLLLGKAYWHTKQTDSARYYFKHVIEKNTKYKEAFGYLTTLEMEQKNSESALYTIEQAIALYPEDKDFEILKLKVFALDTTEDRSLKYMTELVEKYPEDSKLKQQWVELKIKTSSNRVGINYTSTTFNRDGIGPWHLLSLEYIRERKKLSLIGRINYIDRRAFSTSIASGVQYEIESYLVTNSKSYSYANIAYSDAIVFPNLRLAYSYYRSFANGWEADAGMRYNGTTNFKLYTTALGAGKYVGSYWFNLKTYLLFFENKIYPATTATTRYYFNTKYDYMSLQVGLGTSPDERVTLSQFQDRFALHSYRIGAGYNRLVWQKYCIGIQALINRQEYKVDMYQNELNLSVSLQYKF